MSYVQRDFDSMTPDESEVFSFDFVNDVDKSETISSAKWFCTDMATGSSADPDARAHVVGMAAYTGTVTTQRIEGLMGGHTYRLEAIVKTSAGNTRSLHSHVACVTPN